MARKNPNIMVKHLVLKTEWLEDGEECRLELDIEGDTESVKNIVASLTEELRTMFGNE